MADQQHLRWLAGLFLSPGRTVLVMETKAGRRETLRTGSGTDPIITGKVLVLIDEGADAGGARAGGRAP